jgi:AcrR family transcriptional regulator
MQRKSPNVKSGALVEEQPSHERVEFRLVNASTSARAVARRELTQAITAEARSQIAEHGPDGLSLRAVARALGMASSALYRYFPSRDDLLTALIIEAYTALGDAVEAADAPRDRDDVTARFVAVCRAARGWAKTHPREYALIYGSPVPGYRAPQATIDPAARIPIAVFRPLLDGWRAGLVDFPDNLPLTDGLTGQLETVAAAIAPDLPPAAVGAAIGAWIQLFGLISFELFGHLVGSVDPADEFFEREIAGLAARLGLPTR